MDKTYFNCSDKTQMQWTWHSCPAVVTWHTPLNKTKSCQNLKNHIAWSDPHCPIGWTNHKCHTGKTPELQFWILTRSVFQQWHSLCSWSSCSWSPPWTSPPCPSPHWQHCAASPLHPPRCFSLNWHLLLLFLLSNSSPESCKLSYCMTTVLDDMKTIMTSHNIIRCIQVRVAVGNTGKQIKKTKMSLWTNDWKDISFGEEMQLMVIDLMMRSQQIPGVIPYLIFVIFSPRALFFAKFFST